MRGQAVRRRHGGGNRRHYRNDPSKGRHSRFSAARRGHNAYTPEIRKLSPDIPWRKIVAMRHALIHGSLLTELDIVFSTAKRDRLDARD
jgi:hypothetical protein